MINAKQYDFDRSNDKFILNPAQFNPASDGKITEIILTVSPTITTIDAKTIFGKKFLLSKNIHHVASQKKPVQKATPSKQKKKP